ncbi:hypothetical protein V7O66_02445 [Methanolobus sp. ZRKC3]|uniref:hypothetical protein n=1 Tax=Methanolobus sp. ZRKC3 TaxID=3125786 RepID=UPI0032542B57
MSEKTIIPVLNNTTANSEADDSACTGCGKGGCCGGFGIKVGSEKDVVYRNILLYIGMGLIIFATTYLIMQLLAWLM